MYPFWIIGRVVQTSMSFTGKPQLLTWMQLLAKAELSELVDPRLDGNYDKHEVSLCAQIVLLCTRIQPELRPSMSEVRRILEGTMQVPISGSLDTPMTSSHASFVSMGHLSGSFYGTSESLWGLSSIPPSCWLKDIIGFEISLGFVIYSHLNRRSCEDLVVIDANKSTTAQHDHIKHHQRKKNVARSEDSTTQ